MREKVQIFYDSTADIDDILEAGRYSTILLYGLAKDTQIKKLSKIEDYSAYLEEMRFESFIKATTKNSAVKSSLVPTVGAVDEHVKRVYLQIQLWLGNKNINVTDWGWRKCNDLLEPIKMQSLPAPDELLKMIFCNCKKGCGSSCGCRRLGLYCNATCGTCSGDNCQNCSINTYEEEEEFDEINECDV